MRVRPATRRSGRQLIGAVHTGCQIDRHHQDCRAATNCQTGLSGLGAQTHLVDNIVHHVEIAARFQVLLAMHT